MLESSLLTRNKLLKVNNHTIFEGRWPFPNFTYEFEINESHRGRVVEEGDSYELYVDGQSFPSIYDYQYSYGKQGFDTEPPKISVECIEPLPQRSTKPTSEVSEAVRQAYTANSNELTEKGPTPYKIGAPIYEKKEQLSVFDQMKELKRKEL